MKNYELHQYRPAPICDMHIHPHVEAPLEDSLKVFQNIIDHFNYERIALESLPSHDIINNFKVLYFKSRLPNAYANLGLIHHYNETDTQQTYLQQAQAFYRMGCDGFKMLEGKPQNRKQLNRPLDDTLFDGFYDFAEKNELPIVLHFGDPREFWDVNRIPKWALDRGWLYDETYVPFEAAQKEVEGILKKFPNLKLILAHFFFVSDDIDYAEKFMSQWPNVCFDLTPGSEMYDNFNQNITEWKKFFTKHSDRILYGTDIYNWHQENLSIEERYAHAVNLVRSFLEKKEAFWDHWRGKPMQHPFGFNDNVLEKIYRQNFLRVFGKTPRELDPEFIVHQCQLFLSSYSLTDSETNHMNQIINWFQMS